MTSEPTTDHPTEATPSDRLLSGARGAEVWRADAPGAGTVTAHVLDPVADLDVLHEWVNRPHAGFWGLAGLSRDDLSDTYAFVDSLPTHDAYLVRWDGEPVVLVQLYHPEDDPVSTAYDVQPGDLGLHFFKGGDGPAERHGVAHWAVIGPAVLAFAFARPATRRLVGEPDARNRSAVTRMAAFGFEAAGTVRFESPQGPKEAVLAFCARERAEELVAATLGTGGFATEG